MVKPRFLLDTNALSESLRPAPSPSFWARFSAHREQMALAAPTWHELQFGAQRLPAGRRRDAIEEYLRLVKASTPILPYGQDEAAWHAAERARQTALGRPPPLFDGAIAAVAVLNNLILVTNNERDFHGFLGLEVVNWMTP